MNYIGTYFGVNSSSRISLKRGYTERHTHKQLITDATGHPYTHGLAIVGFANTGQL